MKSFLYSLALAIIVKIGFSQNTTNQITFRPYLQANFAIGQFNGINFEQIGVAHKRGDFNEFDTDFDLNVLVSGTSNNANTLGLGLSTGYIRSNNNKKLSAGIGINFNYNNATVTTELANENNEIVTNIDGPNATEVIDLVNHHYSAGHHIFENTFDLSTYTTQLDLSVLKAVTEKISIHASVGIGITYLEANNATSIQLSPAATPPGFETTSDEDGGAVNHFNGNNRAGDITSSFSGKLGVTHTIRENILLLLEIQSTQVGSANLNFGSTQYSDHPPTNHWQLNKESHNAYQLALGFRFVI